MGEEGGEAGDKAVVWREGGDQLEGLVAAVVLEALGDFVRQLGVVRAVAEELEGFLSDLRVLVLEGFAQAVDAQLRVAGAGLDWTRTLASPFCQRSSWSSRPSFSPRPARAWMRQSWRGMGRSGIDGRFEGLWWGPSRCSRA